MNEVRIAIIHEWLVTQGGAEDILSAILDIWPQSDIYTLVYDPTGQCADIVKDHKVKTSFIQKFPKAIDKYRNYLLFMPLAIEQFDLSNYDIIISISHAVSKGVITGPDQLHISYVCSPIRYAWDLQHQYLRQSNLDRGIKGTIARVLLHYIRLWDLRTANGVNEFASISHFIGRRVEKTYRRKSEIIYPPVDIDYFEIYEEKEDFYLVASRMVPYKRIDLVVEAFNEMPDKELIVIGQGPEFDKIRKIAQPNIKLLGYVPDEKMKYLMQRAKAFIFAAEEDFGIIPVEAQACGTPVIAYGKGGALETVIDGKTGLFFNDQTVESLIDAIKIFESMKNDFSFERFRTNAERFAKQRFKYEFQLFIESQWKIFQESINR